MARRLLRWNLGIPLAEYVIVPPREEARHSTGMMLNVIGNEIETDSIQFCPDKRNGCGEYRQPAVR